MLTLHQQAQLDAAAGGSYRLVRALEYPPPGDQLDALWKGYAALAAGQLMPSETADMLARIASVKAAWPKPGV